MFALPPKADIRRLGRDIRLSPRSEHQTSYLPGRRNLPRAVDDRRVLLVRPVQPQHQDEIAGRRRKPVRFLVRAGRIVLDVEIGRTVRIGLQVLPRADRVAIERIVDEEIVCCRTSSATRSPRAGGNWPFGKRITYLFAPLYLLAVGILHATSDRPRPAAGWRRARWR